MERGIRAVVGTATVLALLAAGGIATASPPSVDRGHHNRDTRDRGERGLGRHRLEIALLGRAHAREHAEQRRAERRGALELSQFEPTAAPAAVGPPDQVGAWTTAPFELPNYAIHAVMLPTGKVFFFGYLEGSPTFAGRAAVWDPALGTGPDSFTVVNPPKADVDGDGRFEPAPIFCGGQSLLADGSVFVTGGKLPAIYPKPRGPDFAFRFDPWTETWTREPRMLAGRYYPSQVLLPDGRTLILSGFTEDAPGGVKNPYLESYTPDDNDADAKGTIRHLTSGDRDVGLYPHLFVLPDGNVLMAGPREQDSAVLNTDTFTWDRELPQPALTRTRGTAVLRPQGPGGSWEVTQIGGYDNQRRDAAGNTIPAASSETIDVSQPHPKWVPDASLNVARAHHNTVLLPDGSMVTIGGGIGDGAVGGHFAATLEQRQVELYDPATDTWRLGPSQQETRAYHSTAVLLPSGQVWSSGDNGNPPGATTDTAEIYSPPYLFKGTRPVITSSPAAVAYGERFRIRTKDGVGERAVLIAPGSTTHATDMNQRLVPLKLKDYTPGVGLNVFAPPNAAVAPPGYYMVFVIDSTGVPSKAEWVRLG
jgi:hypothetical protein